MTKVFLNGRIVPAARARVSVYDHGFLYGDGVYETVHVTTDHIVAWPQHYARLRESAKRIALRCPWSSRSLEKAILHLVKANHETDASVRITVARGAGPLGLRPSLSPQPTLAMMLHPARPVEKWRKKGVSIALVDIRRNHPRTLDPQIKSNNSLNTIIARMQADQLKAFEAILLNLDGFLTEGTTCNIFFVRKSILYTPALSCGLLAGVTRANLIKRARARKMTVREGRYTPTDLRRADEVFLASTTLGIMPVVQLIEKSGTKRRRVTSIGSGRPGAITGRLHHLLGNAL